jgi:hypothetical protein
MVRKELEWVASNVKNKSDGVATGIRDVDDCQPFVMTAPGPGQEGDDIGKQREFGPVFFLLSASRFITNLIIFQRLGIRIRRRKLFVRCLSLTIRSTPRL